MQHTNSVSRAHVAGTYSIVVPLYNEQDNIVALYERLKQTMEALGRPFEFVFIDDGSTDDSLTFLEQISLVDSRVTVVELGHNSGKSAALAAGFNVARGDFIVTMDGDLQHDPADIPRFISKLDEGFDIVCGCRTERPHTSWLQRQSNRTANWALRKLTGINIHDWGGGFKAYKHTLVSHITIYGELQRLIPVLALRHSARVCEIPITIAPRQHGDSKYGISRKLPVIFDIITVRFLQGYLSRPLHLFGAAGALSMLAGNVIGFALLMARVVYGVHVMAEHGPLLIFAAVLIISGVQLLALGLLAEMLVRYHHENRGSRLPTEAAYVIRNSNLCREEVLSTISPHSR